MTLSRIAAISFLLFCTLASVCTSAKASQATAPQGGCSAAEFQWLGRSPVSELKSVSLLCKSPDSGKPLIGFRQFVKAKVPYLLLVNPDTFATEVRPASCVLCEPTSQRELPNFRLVRALEKYTNTRPAVNLIRDAGIEHAEGSVPGYFLTVDLCPSKKEGLDEQIFLAIRNVLDTHRNRAPVPVGLSVSGQWIMRHPLAMEWLQKQEREKRIKITWINHTLNHPFNPELPLDHNFLLGGEVKFDSEVLGLESLLLSRGLVPSIFFRFPGLVASGQLMERLRSFMLIPLGTNAWLAKNEKPAPGSIILIHGNHNEEQGVQDFVNWYSKNADQIEFLDLSNLF